MHQGEALKARRVGAGIAPGILAKAAHRTPAWVNHTESRARLRPETIQLFESALATCTAARHSPDAEVAARVGLVLIGIGRNLLAGVAADG
jgi:hypothetical protein